MLEWLWFAASRQRHSHIHSYSGPDSKFCTPLCMPLPTRKGTSVIWLVEGGKGQGVKYKKTMGKLSGFSRCYSERWPWPDEDGCTCQFRRWSFCTGVALHTHHSTFASYIYIPSWTLICRSQSQDHESTFCMVPIPCQTYAAALAALEPPHY